MNPILIVGAVNGAISIVEQLMPLIHEYTQSGEITAEQQASLMARIDAIRSGKFFETPQWSLPPKPQATQ